MKMKTIKERAEDYANENWTLDEANFACEDGYIKGATEQIEIDIEKACEWLKNNAVIGLMNEEVDDFIEDFREAMKGE